jgi:hypothetical protein
LIRHGRAGRLKQASRTYHRGTENRRKKTSTDRFGSEVILFPLLCVSVMNTSFLLHCHWATTAPHRVERFHPSLPGRCVAATVRVEDISGSHFAQIQQLGARRRGAVAAAFGGFRRSRPCRKSLDQRCIRHAPHNSSCRIVSSRPGLSSFHRKQDSGYPVLAAHNGDGQCRAPPPGHTETRRSPVGAPSAPHLSALRNG